MDLGKLTAEISKLYQTPGLTLRQTHALIARHIAMMVLEARIDELMIQVYGLGYYNSRIAELENEITKLRRIGR